MDPKTGKFEIFYATEGAPVTLEKSGLVLGRLASCDVVLDHASVSRIHAGINYLGGKYSVVNLSASNVLTLNGRLVAAQSSDFLANGDIIQIGPFIIDIAREGAQLILRVRQQLQGEYRSAVQESPDESAGPEASSADVLKVFWEKRTRDREDQGTRLRPVGNPEPGKAIIKWKPTGDLRRPWRTGLFIWTFLIFGAFAVFAFWRYPQTFASKPLASPHIRKIDGSMIAAQANENSCTTCHSLSQPIEAACIKCHQAEGFHASNTKAHEEAGIACTVCHKEHEGEDFPMREEARLTCAECHNDKNTHTYNGKTVRTAHGGSFGYPAENGDWKWNGLYTEVAETIPALHGRRVRGETEQALLSRQFHSAHVSRLLAPAGMAADGRGRVSCSTCHKSFDPVDRETPRKMCAGCHNNAPESAVTPVNCISCHIQHPFSARRWDAFLAPEAAEARKKAVDTQIKNLNEK